MASSRRARGAPPRLLDYNATLIGRDDFTDELSTFHVRYDAPLDSEPAFVPGQYVAVGLNNEASPEFGAVRRSMSIASAPEQGEALQFYMRFVRRPTSDNPLTHLIWTKRAGDRLHVTRKPVGKFTIAETLGEDDARARLCVAAGTGLAPFLSMLRSMRHRDSSADMSRFVLIHAASYPADLCYADELRGYAERHGLHYFASVSRPQEAPGWTGDTGRAEDYFLPERLEAFEARAGFRPGELTPHRAGVLVCGLQGTIARCIERLAPRGFAPFHRRLRNVLGLGEDRPPSLWWEQYDAEPVIDVKDAEAVERLKLDLQRAAVARPG